MQNGTKAKAAQRSIEHARAGVERGRSIRDAHAAGIVQMDADRFRARDLDDGCRQLADLFRPGIADGIGDRDHVDTGLEQFLGDPDHFLRVHRTDDRAAQRHRDRGVHDRLVALASRNSQSRLTLAIADLRLRLALAWLCSSVAETTVATSATPDASASLTPRSLSASAMP